MLGPPGWGDQLERPYDEIVRDVLWGKVSVEAARTDYGAIVTETKEAPAVDMVTDLDHAFSGLTEPKDLTRPFDKLLAQFLSKVTDGVVVSYAITLLGGEDPTLHPTALRHLGGAHADLLMEKHDLTLWPSVWGARALRYVWTPQQGGVATRLVVAHLEDPRWRVAEMCAKVVRKRELGEGADALVPLTGHRLPRVRMQAIRALGKVGETEQLAVIHQALSDEDQDVRRAAAKAMEQRASQLDLDLNDLLEGRFR